MNKVCSNCNENKDKIKDFSDRQRTKKFGKCNACLAPKHASQKYTPSLAADQCKKCHGPITGYNQSQTDNSLCYVCSTYGEHKSWTREYNAALAKKREEEAKKRKYKEQKRQEEKGEYIHEIVGEGIKLNHDRDGRVYFGADD